MIDPDIKNLADLWQQPDGVEAEVEAFDRLARKARRQARLLAFGDLAWTLLVAGSVIVAAVVRPSALGFAAAALTLAVMGWLNWRRHAMRRSVNRIDTHDRGRFIESSVVLARANLRRVTLSLVTLLPTILVAIVFRVVTKDAGDIHHPIEPLLRWVTSPRGIIAVAVLAGIGALTLRSRLKLAAELRRLEDLRREYAREALLDEEEDLPETRSS